MPDRSDPERSRLGLSRRRVLQGATGLTAALAGCGTNAVEDVDTTVSSAAALQAAFDGLSAGETIYISAANAPYRTTEWLDIDEDDVAVIGPGLPDLIKPSDGADVGGIRIGHHSHCENVVVSGVGFHGNRDGQSGRSPRLHGIAVRDAANVTLANNHLRRLGPLGHGDGGSGISVTRHCSDIRVVGNVIEDWGDRGIQLAGSRLIATGNRLEGGLDRAISCDLWYPRETNHSAQHALVSGNLMGEVREGSLTGVAHNTPVDEARGNINVVGNVGFGAHKSLCHVRGPEPFRNVTIQSNTSIQETDGLDTEETETYAGVAVDAEAGETLSVRNNEFYGYSGHGVNVDSEIHNVAIQQNTLARPSGTGVRVRHAISGQVTGNLVVDPGKNGLRLEDALDLVVRNNYVRRPGGAGIDVRGSHGTAGHDVASNFLADTGGDGDASAIRICDRGVRVRGNTVRRHSGEAAAISACQDAGANVFETNHADGDDPWSVASADSRVRNNTPPVDVHHGLEADPDSEIVAVEFDRSYARPPRLTFGRTAGSVRDTTFRTDSAGNFVGAELSVEEAGTFDVFVDDA